MRKPRDTLTYTYPRSLEQAFGPYERTGLVGACTPLSRSDLVIVWLGVVALLVVLVMAGMGWLPGAGK